MDLPALLPVEDVLEMSPEELHQYLSDLIRPRPTIKPQSTTDLYRRRSDGTLETKNEYLQAVQKMRTSSTGDVQAAITTNSDVLPQVSVRRELPVENEPPNAKTTS